MRFVLDSDDLIELQMNYFMINRQIMFIIRMF